MNGYEIGRLCLNASAAGPQAFANEFLDEERGCPIDLGGPAALGLQGQPDAFQPMFWMPLKLSTLGAAQLAAIGTLLASGSPSQVGLMSLGRSVLEGVALSAGCSMTPLALSPPPTSMVVVGNR